MKKSLFLLLVLGCGILCAQFNPKMRNNFGANHATFRINAGYFTTAYKMDNRVYEQSAVKAPQGMLGNMRLNVESMIMVNNRYGFSESVSRHPAQFILGRAAYDGFTNTMLTTLAFAKSTKCRTTLPFFGQIKGFWGIGATMRFKPNENSGNIKSNIGTRLSLNVYNKTSAFQAETYIFSNGVMVNALVYKKIAENFLFSAGVENNLPKLGLSAMLGSSRISAYTQLYKKDLQGGLQMTINL